MMFFLPKEGANLLLLEIQQRSLPKLTPPNNVGITKQIMWHLYLGACVLNIMILSNSKQDQKVAT